MIKSGSEMIHEIKEQMRGGKGSIELTHIFKQNELKGKARLVAKITINPGCSIGWHEHVAEEEIFYLISGKGLFNDNGTEKEITAGDAALTGGGAYHAVENREKEPLVLLAVILVW